MSNNIENLNEGSTLQSLAKKITLKKNEFETEIYDLPSTVVEALYHEITGKKEKMEFSFGAPKAIDYESLRDLKDKLYQNCEKYHGITSNLTIKYEQSDRRTLIFSSWEKFSRHDWRTNNRSTELTLIFEFIVKSKLGTHNHYKIEFSISSFLGAPRNINKELMENYRKRYERNELRETATIEYVDSLVARDFYNLILDWHENANDSNFKYYSKFLSKQLHIIYYVIDSCFALSFLIVLYCGYINSVSGNTYIEISKPIFISIFYIFAALSLGKFSLAFLHDSIRNIHNLPVINLTPGDEQAIKKQNSRNGKWASIAGFFLCTFSITLILNITSNYLYDYLKTILFF